MKKQVPVESMKFGVYIHELDRPWTDTPFMFQGFVLNTEAQFNALKKHCKKVFIDTDKGMDVGGENPFSGGPLGASGLEPIKTKVNYGERASLKREAPVARQTQQRTALVLKYVFNTARAGKAIDDQ